MVSTQSCEGNRQSEAIYLGLRVGPCREDDTKGEQKYCDDLNTRISLPPEIAGSHGRNTSSRSEDDMHGDRDIIAEGMVVQHIDTEE